MARPEQGTESIHVSVPSATPFVFERTLLLSAGNMDPWHALSVVNGTDPFYESGSSQETTPGVTIVEIDGTAHCRDMYAPGTFEDVGIPDTSSVQWGHAVIAQNVAEYIGASTSKNKK